MRSARSAPVASAERRLVSTSLGPSVTTTTSPRRVLGALPSSFKRSAASSAYSSNGLSFHSRLPVSTFWPPAPMRTLLALSGSATRLMATRIFTLLFSCYPSLRRRGAGPRVFVQLAEELHAAEKKIDRPLDWRSQAAGNQGWARSVLWGEDYDGLSGARLRHRRPEFRSACGESRSGDG